MKIMFSSGRYGYIVVVNLFLIIAALIAGVVGCEGEVGPEYELNMSVAPPGSGTAADETSTPPYAEGIDIHIKAVATDCYRFVSWMAPHGIFGNTTAAETTFIMPARDVTVTANFELVPSDHFKFYDVEWETAPDIGTDVQLVDQFGAIVAAVGKAVSFGNPVEKVHAGMTTRVGNLNRHYTLYDLIYEGEPQEYRVIINNQFQDDVELTVFGPYYLAVPTQKENHEMAGCLNHFLVYDAYGPVANDEVVLSDQFIQGEVVVVYQPYLYANPVRKTMDGDITEIEDPNEHWLLYDIEAPSIDKNIQIDNQFGRQTLDLLQPEYLAVPSQKIEWSPVD